MAQEKGLHRRLLLRALSRIDQNEFSCFLQELQSCQGAIAEEWREIHVLQHTLQDAEFVLEDSIGGLLIFHIHGVTVVLLHGSLHVLSNTKVVHDKAAVFGLVATVYAADSLDEGMLR